MGKGDKKTRKGKIAMGSFGKSRPHHVKKVIASPVADEKETANASKAKKPSA
jgi:30S ribosomal protein S31